MVFINSGCRLTIRVNHFPTLSNKCLLIVDEVETSLYCPSLDDKFDCHFGTGFFVYKRTTNVSRFLFLKTCRQPIILDKVTQVLNGFRVQQIGKKRNNFQRERSLSFHNEFLHGIAKLTSVFEAMCWYLLSNRHQHFRPENNLLNTFICSRVMHETSQIPSPSFSI